MGRLIDEALLQEKLALIPMEERTFRRTVEELENAPTVEVHIEAIPIDLYETRLKADMVAMLEDLRLDFQEAELAGVLDNKELIFADEVDDLVQQRINNLKED